MSECHLSFVHQVSQTTLRPAGYKYEYSHVQLHSLFKWYTHKADAH